MRSIPVPPLSGNHRAILDRLTGDVDPLGVLVTSEVPETCRLLLTCWRR